MVITRKSQVSGVTRSMDLPVTHEQMRSYADGELIQRAFPNLTNAQREFIMTVITQEEWDETFGEEE